MSYQMPFITKIAANVDAVAATTVSFPADAVGTAGNDLSTLAKAPVSGRVSGVSYLPAANLSGANTNSRTLSLINKGDAGAGTTSVASLALVSGTDLTAFDEKTITLAGTVTDRDVVAGDVLQWQSLHVLTGIVDPGGTVVVDIAPGDKSTTLRVPSAGSVSSVTYIPAASQSGAATNSRTLNLVNKGSAGAGTTVVATLALASGVNLTAFDEKTITVSSTAADLVVAEGDVLQWQSLHVGTGIADPGGTVIVTIDRTA